MPSIFSLGSYKIYFWSNESNPLEPVHVHICEGEPSMNDTKIWLTKAGKTILCHNKGRIPDAKLRGIMDVVEARHFEVLTKWHEHFGELKFYC